MSQSPLRPAAEDSAAWPAPGAAWYMVGVLMLLYVLSFIDRQIIGLLVDPIKREFGVSDTQVGLLQGLTFALFYCALGIPFGWMVDRFGRRWIVAVGVFLWSLMATLCGLARTFPQLVLARMGVGVGEAALSPAAYSLIADAFPPHKLGRAFGVYNMGVAIGSGIAAVLGGLVVNAVGGGHGYYSLPLLGEVRAWQLVFIVTGAPGVLMCLLMFTVREPLRRGVLRVGDHVQRVALRDTLAFLGARIEFFGPFFVGVGLLSIAAYGVGAWLAVAFNRKFGVPVGDVALVNGSITLVFNTFGIFMAGRLADALYSRGRRDAAVRLCLCVACSTLVWGTLAPLMPSLHGTYAVLALLSLTISAYAGLVPMAINLVTPNQMRGQASAVYLLVNNLIGLGLGPALIPFVSDHVIGDSAKVYLSMAFVTATCTSAAALIFFVLLPRYRRRLEEAAAWNEAIAGRAAPAPGGASP
jgi:MFS family permease